MTAILFLKGGGGSGNFGHTGRPGLVGGSRGGQSDSMREIGFGTAKIPVLAEFETDAPIKAHPAYAAAKAGDANAAVSLVQDMARGIVTQAGALFGSSVIYAAPTAREAKGDNAIPDVLAEALAIHSNARSDMEIMQTSRAHHTGADPMERLTSRPEFSGTVTPGATYVLADDVLTLGGTLAEMANHIHQNGGKVVGAVLLVNASRTGRLIAQTRFTAELERRFGHEIRSLFGVAPAALTSDEAQYLIGFRTADELRNRAAKAQESQLHRLRAKGIFPGLG